VEDGGPLVKMAEPLRERKKRLVRRQIADAALAQFRTKGYERTRIRDVVEAAGVSEGTFFNYFPTKDSILRHFVFEYLDRYEELLEGSSLDPSRTVADQLADMSRLIAAIVTEDRAFMMAVVPALFSARGRVKERELRATDHLAGIFGAGQARGEIDQRHDPRQLAEVITGTYHLTVLNWLLDWWGEKWESSLEQRLLAALDILLRGATPR
jgi:AcrR family transcriptional regulator